VKTDGATDATTLRNITWQCCPHHTAVLPASRGSAARITRQCCPHVAVLPASRGSAARITW